MLCVLSDFNHLWQTFTSSNFKGAYDNVDLVCPKHQHELMHVVHCIILEYCDSVPGCMSRRDADLFFNALESEAFSSNPEELVGTNGNCLKDLPAAAQRYMQVMRTVLFAKYWVLTFPSC